MDGGELFAACLLIGGFLAGALVLLIALFLAIQMAWQRFHGKSEQGQEEEQASAVAHAYVIQRYYDSLYRWELYMTILVAQAVMLRHFDRFRDGDTGPMPAV